MGERYGHDRSGARNAGASIAPGEQVRCIDASTLPGKSWKGDGPVEGETYTVLDLPGLSPGGEPICRLVELQRAPSALQAGKIGYGLWRFQPVKATS